ncbi:40S ribosomal protein S21 [Perkinsus olseni]|uniref:40S ribosomal protein S21 n=1 Tax=Perkinsus olseni TaxID=32597 RepID=A0A7J6TKE6_PEROL|nr:40S ribosomal protein S21 [Perkinsus olseni]
MWDNHRDKLTFRPYQGSTALLQRLATPQSAQFNVAVVDPKTGLATGEFHPICIAGYMRGKGESDACVNRLLHEKNILTFAE